MNIRHFNDRLKRLSGLFVGRCSAFGRTAAAQNWLRCSLGLLMRLAGRPPVLGERNGGLDGAICTIKIIRLPSRTAFKTIGRSRWQAAGLKYQAFVSADSQGHNEFRR